MNYNFDVSVAKEYGVNEAIMIANFQFWILKNKVNDINYYDGRYWTYNSVKAFEELFPFWSSKVIRSIIEKLVEKGVLIKGNYNKSSYDRTLWYAFVDEGKWIGRNEEFHLPKWENGFSEKGKAIPDIKPDIKPDIYNNTPPISPPVGGDDSKIKNQDEDKVKNLCLVSVPSGWKNIEMPKDEIIIPVELREAMDLWLKYRKEIKKPYKPMGLRECVKKLEKLSGNDRAVAVEIVRESISNGWTGLFPLKKKLDMKGKDEYKNIVDMMEKFIDGE